MESKGQKKIFFHYGVSEGFWAQSMGKDMLQRDHFRKLRVLGVWNLTQKRKLEDNCKWLRTSWWRSKSGQWQWEVEGRRRLSDSTDTECLQ